MPQQKKNLDHEEMARMASPTPGDTHLLAIAIDAYAHCPRLSNCVKDAKDFVALMQERYQVAPERTYTLYDEEATRKQALQLLKQLRSKIGADDSLIVYFSGHGEVEDDHAYWVPVEGKPSEDDEWIPAADIKRRLNVIKSFHTLLIVDACFSGSFFYSPHRSVSSVLHSRRSRLGMSASHSRERALDGRPGENSPFAQELLRALRYNEQPLPADMLFAQVREGVLAATKNEQTPIFSPIDVKGHEYGQYVFMPAVQAEAAWAATAALPDETIPEIDAKRAELLRFCENYSDSLHFDAAVDLGEDLEYKSEFLNRYDSVFRLLAFSKRDTPYREAAKQRLTELKAQVTASLPVEEPKRSPQPKSKPEPPPDDEAKRSRQPKFLADLIYIPSGTFEMGDVMGDGEYNNEVIHTVTLSAFELGRYEVTFEEYDAFCAATGRDKPSDKGWGRGRRPVINVSWYDVVAYCNWLSEQHGYMPVYTISGDNVSANWTTDGYRLPTEAEWEYAARGGGQKVRFGNGKDVADPKEINFAARGSYKKPYSVVGEYRGRTVPVGSLNSPNALGLHDMSGNVWEWCWDWYGDYPTRAQMNPRGADSGSARVDRGGGWYYAPRGCRAAYRNFDGPTSGYDDLGFRLARSSRS